MNALKLKELLLSPVDAHKIAHVARNYRSDNKKFEVSFKKTVSATEKDLVIKVDDYSSTDLIQIKTEGQQLITDVGGFKSGRDLFVRVPKGQDAEIEFPVYPQVASMSGHIWDRRFANWEQQAECIETLNDTSKCAAVQVVAMHNAVLFVGGDENVWGMGMRAQGRSHEDS